LSIASSTSEALGSGTGGSAVCISVCPLLRDYLVKNAFVPLRNFYLLVITM